MEQYRIELGLYVLDDKAERGRWTPTPLVEQLRAYINNPADAIGELDPSALAATHQTAATKAHLSDPALAAD